LTVYSRQRAFWKIFPSFLTCEFPIGGVYPPLNFGTVPDRKKHVTSTRPERPETPKRDVFGQIPQFFLPVFDPFGEKLVGEKLVGEKLKKVFIPKPYGGTLTLTLPLTKQKVPEISKFFS